MDPRMATLSQMVRLKQMVYLMGIEFLMVLQKVMEVLMGKQSRKVHLIQKVHSILLVLQKVRGWMLLESWFLKA